MPSVWPASSSKSTPVDGPDRAGLGAKPRPQVLDAQELAHQRAGPGVRTVMCRSTASIRTSRVTGLERGQQLAVLDREARHVGLEPEAEEVRADAWGDAAPDLRRVRLTRAGEHELVEADVRLDAAQQVAGAGALSHQPDLLRELPEVRVGHQLERLREAEPLERQADRDQDLVHLLVGDPEHHGAAIGVRDDEPLVLELAERLADRAAARVQLARDAILDQPLTVGQLADDDRLAQGFEHLLAAGAAPLRALDGRVVGHRGILDDDRLDRLHERYC